MLYEKGLQKYLFMPSFAICPGRHKSKFFAFVDFVHECFSAPCTSILGSFLTCLVNASLICIKPPFARTPLLFVSAFDCICRGNVTMSSIRYFKNHVS